MNFQIRRVGSNIPQNTLTVIHSITCNAISRKRDKSAVFQKNGQILELRVLLKRVLGRKHSRLLGEFRYLNGLQIIESVRNYSSS